MPLESFEDIMKEKWYDKFFKPYRKGKYRLISKKMECKFKRQCKKQGYADCDVWEMRSWFVGTAKPILLEMVEKTNNHPDEITFEEWREIIKRMAHLLDIMDIWDDTTLRKELGIPKNDVSEDTIKRISEKRNEAKNEFFYLFNKWFYDLWY